MVDPGSYGSDQNRIRQAVRVLERPVFLNILRVPSADSAHTIVRLLWTPADPESVTTETDTAAANQARKASKPEMSGL